MKRNSKEKTARIYSSALYDAAVESSQLETVKENAKFLSELCKQDRDLVKQVSSPLLSEVQQKEIWQQIAKKAKLSAEILKCLDILTENHRIDILADVMDDFSHLYYIGKNIAEVDVETVKPLTTTQDKKLREVLIKKFNKDVVIKYTENPEILGGLRVVCGSKMFDGSLSYKLNCLENIMKGN